MRIALALIAASAAPAFAQEAPPAPGWSYPQLTTVQPTQPLPAVPPPVYVPAPAPTPLPTYLPERTVAVEEVAGRPDAAPGQQHWVSANLGVFQPFTARVAVKVVPRPQNSIWVEAFAGSALFDAMYGFGVRVQHTVRAGSSSNRLMVAPGFGVHILPDWQTWEDEPYRDSGYGYAGFTTTYYRNPLYYLFADVDVSWLHDFSPHFGMELGVKVGIAGRVSGRVGQDYPEFVMFGKDVYPLFSVFSGFRF